MMRHNNLLWKWAICRHLFPLLIFAVGMTKMNAQTLNKVSRDALMQSVQQEIPDRNSSTNTMQIVNSLPRTSRTNGQLDYTAYDWQSNAGAITRTIVWPDGKVNFGFTHASNASYSDRGTAIGTYDAVSDQWISSGGRVESEKTGFGSIARYGENGIVIAAHNSTTVGIFIIGNKDDVTSLQGSVSAVSHLNDSKEPTWANVMTSGPNRDIIHVVATGWSDNKIYYFRSQDGGQTWDKQNVVLPFMGSDYGPYWGSNCCYWMETTEDNCLSLVVNNPWSDGMVIYSYDNGETWQRKVFYQHPNPFGTFNEMFLYPRWTSCQWDSQHHLHVLYEFTGCSGSPNSSNSYPSVGGVAYWNETMPYNPNGITQSAIPGNLTPGQPFVMDKDYLYNDIYSSWWNYPNATHVMWPEYIGYLPALDDNGNWEDPYQATQFNITDWALHGFYHSSVCGFPVLCKVPGTDGMVAVWCAMDENHTDINGNFYFKIFASYSGNGGVNWTNMVHLTNTPAYHDKELVYLQATIVGNKLIIAAQCDGETGTYVQNNDSDPNDTYYQGFTFDLNELFDISGDLVSISATPNPSAGGHIFGTGSYTPGSTCTLTATAFEGYTFVNWTENGEVVSTANPYTFTVTGNRSLVANFTVSGGDEHEYVDLGLPSGLLWATCNVGASSPEEYGDCFAWGETQPKDTYNWNNYQYCNGSNNTLTKYCNDANYGYNGFTDTLTILQPSDDAATANWGAYWHTPTKEEWQELYQNTTHVWTTQNGVNGQLFTASNGNSLFLPATAGRYGYYWLSSVNTDSPSNAWELYFSSGNYCGTDYYDRYYGQSVRAVRSPMQNTYFIIDVTANPAEGGEITGGGDYQEGVDCTLTATANAGYTFVNWTENGEVVSTENPYIFTVTNNRVLEAVFTTSTQTTFTKVTSASGLEVGANYLIVGHNDELGVFAMGYQKPNNRNAVVVDEVGDAISVTIGTDPNSQTDVFQFTLGGFTDAWTFFDEVKGGYLYAGSSTSNQLKTQTTLDANGQWSITFNADGTAEVVAQGENGHNNMRFNPNIMNITPLFSCYAETSTIDTRVSFYKAGNAVQSYYITTTANPEEGGTINGGGSYAIGSTCTLTATANAGYTFVNWTENGEVVSTANPYTFTVTGNRNLVANFSGGVSVLLFEDFNENLGVFTAYDVIGAQSWHQGSYQGVTYANMNGYANGYNQNEDWLISPALNKTGFSDVFVEFRTAMKFDGAPLRVKISTNYNGQGNPNNYDWQDITDVFNFSTGNYEWVESGRIGVNIPANVFYLAFVYTSNTQAATAWNIDYVRIEASGYGVASYDITVTANPPTGGTVTGGGNYYEGQTCTLTATANEGYTFINWTENGEVVSTENPYIFTVTGNRDLVSNFTNSGGDEHQYVDLGLPSGTLWATCNVGADTPEGYGDYFAWGETQPKDYYEWSTYQYCNGTSDEDPQLTKYCNNSNYGYNGFTDTLTILLPEDDAATANWGSDWRTPTNEDWEELYNSTTNVWTTQNGVNGRLFTSSNGNSLFIPAAGFRYENSLYGADNVGRTWTNSINTGNPSIVGMFVYNSYEYLMTNSYRFYGRSVRAVRSSSPNLSLITVTPNPAEGGTVTGGGNYTQGQTCTLTATPNEGYQFLYWTEDEDVVSMEATYSFTVTDNRTLVANFVAYNPSGDLQVFAEYYPDSSNVFSPYVKVYWTGITASRYNIYRAFCYSDDYELIAENVTDTLYIDYAWFNLPLGNYKYGVSVEDGRGGAGQIHWNDAPVATNEILIDASTFGNPTANNGSLEMPLRVNYDNGWLHYDNGNYIKSIGSGLGMLHWGVKFPSETLASYAGNQLKKVAVYMRSGNNEILNISVHVGGTTAPGMSVCSMDFDVSGYNNGFVEFALPEPIFITGTENIWITLSQAGNYPAQASPDSGEPNGRWISLNGQTWMDMANYGLDGSWMIRGYVGDDPAIYWSNCIDKTHYSITATANPTEGGTVTGGGAYSQGTTCTLTAMANSGYHFANWTENGVVVSTNANYSFTVTRSRNLVAHFTTNSQVCAINVSTNPSYGGSANGGGYYYYGTICTVNALANSGYIFTNWTENGTVVSIDASYTFTVTGSRNLVANFTAIPQFCTINVYANPSYGGSVTGTGTYAYGINCTLTATATTGYIFLNWTENGTVVSTSSNYTFTVTRNRNLVANFTADLPYYGINAVPNPNEGGTITGTGIYMEGQNCTLKAFANSGYTFINWTKNGVVVSTNATYRFVVTEAANYVANFELRSYAITVTASPTEGGTVAGAGTYYYGATCTVTATANSGYFFANWTLNGRVVSYSAEYIFTVTGNRNLVANFVTNPQVCTISTFTNPSYGGTAIGAGYYYTGASCTLTATANSGYAFVNWTENNVVVSTEAEYTFTVTGDRNLAANFTPVGTISAIANPNYGGSITGGGTYQYGTRCTLRATANSGYLFVNWTENGVTVSTNAKYSFTVMGNRNLVANFTVNNNPQVYMISVFANPSYGGSITGSNTYAYGTSCTVTATANSGYTFLNWTENGTVVSTNADYTFTVTGNRTLLANFMADTQLYTINTFANPSYGGTVSGDGGFYYGSSCTVTATANNGYTFVNWTENGTVVSFNANYTFTVKRNRNLVANFSANMEYFGINATPNPIEGGTITGAGIYIEGQTCTLTASPSFGYVFVNWTENGTVVSFDASYTFTVTGSRSLVANFADDMSFVGINANPNPIEGGAIMGAGLYLPGQTCILMAVANSGYIFVNWTENGTVVSDNAECTFIVTGSRNLVANFDIQPSVTQTIQLSQGWNWCSFNVEITLDDLKAALVAALPGTAINIKSQTQNVMYQNGRWTGSLTALNLTRMYMISVGNNCEISLEGQPINPSTLTVTINSGVNWIAFPYSESMTVTDFFGSFPANNDQVKSQSQNARYQGNRWAGQLSTLVPGKGYMYISNTQGTRTFTFPANAK